MLADEKMYFSDGKLFCHFASERYKLRCCCIGGGQNNNELTAVLEMRRRKLCEKEGEAEFVEKANAGSGKYSVFTNDFHCDVIKAGHHGSRTSTGTAFVETVTKSTEIQNTLMVISCGFDNSYGHPHAEKLEQFKQNGFKEENILRTDKNGSIVLSVNDAGQLLYGASPIVKTPTVITMAIYRQSINFTGVLTIGLAP